MENKDDEYYYVIFALGSDLLDNYNLGENNDLKLETDSYYEYCKKIADDFYSSEYNVSSKSIYACLEDYLGNTFKREI